jgi:hypothetical protein
MQESFLKAFTWWCGELLLALGYKRIVVNYGIDFLRTTNSNQKILMRHFIKNRKRKKMAF